MKINQKASSELLSTSLFLILNLVFVVILLVFVSNSSQGAYVYEEMYAKQIALFIDNAEPGTLIGLNIEKAVEIAGKNKKPLDKIIRIDENTNEVIVSLSSGGGRSYKYFSNYKVSTQIVEDKLEIIIENG